MAYRINFANCSGVFGVPTTVVDDHLRICGALQLKVLLLLLRQGAPLPAEEIANTLHQSVADVRDALAYWIQCGLIEGEAASVPYEASAVETAAVQTPPPLESTAANAAEEPAPSAGESRRTILIGEKSRLSRGECLEMANADATLSKLFDKAQQLAGRPLSSVDMQCITSLYSYYGLGADYILLVMSYCKSINKLNMRYVERTTADWLEKGIDTFEKADAHIRQLDYRKTNEGQVQSAFGIGNRSLTSTECKYITKWFETYGYDIRMIRLAYERSIDNIGQIKFSYIDKVLTNWYQQGIRTTQEAAEESSRPRRKKSQHSNTSYDLGELEARMLQDFMKHRE